MSRYTAMVVDDSAFMRKVVSDLIMDDPDFKVIWTAKNGQEALQKVQELQPDVITMDIEMPVMNGLKAVEHIMRQYPTPIVMLSSLTEEGAKETIQALELGAVDFVRKPSGSISLDIHKVKKQLQDKLRMAVSVQLRKTQPLLPVQVVPIPKKEKIPALLSSASIQKKESHGTRLSFQHLVAIGTSTGGPRALQQVITGLPENFPAPVLIVQHMPPNFTKSLAQRLNSLSQIRVVEAEEGMPVERGTVYIAPGGWHMKMVKENPADYRIRLSKDEPRSSHRPSVDYLYESLLPFKELKRHIVIMTGMGSDGARGMKALLEAGAESTIAESEQTCVVYGMPRAAVEINAAKYVLDLQEIPKKLMELVHN